jgi:uncharacterized protein
MRSQIKKISILGIGIIVVCLFFLLMSHPLPEIPQPSDSRAIWGLPRAMILTPTGYKIHVEVASNQHARETGLMFRTIVPSGTGMLFVYGEDSSPGIWMKNTWVALDILWLDRNHRITAIRRSVPPDNPSLEDEQRPVYAGFGEYVVELAAGESDRLGLVKGMLLKINML